MSDRVTPAPGELKSLVGQTADLMHFRFPDEQPALYHSYGCAFCRLRHLLDGMLDGRDGLASRHRDYIVCEGAEVAFVCETDEAGRLSRRFRYGNHEYMERIRRLRRGRDVPDPMAL